jgi:Astacin (Peptidase family M12A)
MATQRRKPTGQGTEGNDVGVGEFRSGPLAGTVLLDGVTFQRRPVLWSEVDGLALVEGDIVLGPVAAVRGDTAGAESLGITGSRFRWPSATVPFTIDSALPNQDRVTDAIAHWEARTRIRLVPRDPAQHGDWVHFKPGGGCSSAVGRQRGRQDITLGSGCSTGNAIHEIGHALGLWHEQSRQDRDDFVRIVFANIDPTKTHNFTQHISDGDDLGAYDYGSLMHYPPKAFSTNGQDTVVPLQPLPPGVVMGQRNGLSAGDVAGIHALYPLGSITIKEASKEPVLDPVATRKEFVADPVATNKELVKEPLKDPVVDPVLTAKEGAFDPPFPPVGFTPVPIPGPDPSLAQTFVTGAPSRAPAAAAATGADRLDGLAVQVAQLGAALAVAQQQHAALAAAYEQLTTQLAQAQGQG